jgi:quinol monooxygenase YgiN
MAFMYGLIGRFICHPGTRDRLASLLTGMGSMPGCHSYVVALDTDDPDGLWVTEVWDDAEAHVASLQLESVKTAIAEGRRYIAAMDPRFETRPIGGVGLDPSLG